MRDESLWVEAFICLLLFTALYLAAGDKTLGDAWYWLGQVLDRLIVFIEGV